MLCQIFLADNWVVWNELSSALNLKKSLLDISAQALYDADHDIALADHHHSLEMQERRAGEPQLQIRRAVERLGSDAILNCLTVGRLQTRSCASNFTT